MFRSNSLPRSLRFFFPPLLLVIVAAALFPGCGQTELTSRWRDRDLVIDGDAGDWEGLLHYVEGARGSIGIVNDDEFLYLCLVSVDGEVYRQVMGRGFYVWLDGQGENRKGTGVRYPRGMAAGPGSGKGMRPEPGGGDDEIVSAERREALLGELEIHGPGDGEVHTLSVDATEGLEAKIGHHSGALVYELKIPLRSEEASLALFPKENRFALGLETAAAQREARKTMRRKGGQGGRPPMARPEGSSGLRGSGMTGPPGPGKSIEVWASVLLASASSTE